MTSQPINLPKPHQKVELVTHNKFAKFHHYTPNKKKVMMGGTLFSPPPPRLDKVKLPGYHFKRPDQRLSVTARRRYFKERVA